MKRMIKYRKLTSWILIVLLSFSLGFVTDVSDNYFEISKNLDIFGKLYREINSLYVDDTDPSKLMRTGVDAMLNSLDPYTNYISEEEVEDFKFMSTGHYGGIGALIGKREDFLVVLEPYQNYPADQAGIKAGDILVKVGNVKIEGTSKKVADVRSLLRGKKGTEVELTVRRNESEKTLKLTRDRIKIDNVPWYGMINNELGYISLEGFTQDAGKEVREATMALQKEHSQLKGIVLDLRGNPGGRLDEAVNVSNVFVPQKEIIVETRGRSDDSRRTHAAQRSPVSIDIPLAVLVNSRSASAAEIVAGSIQDLDRGVIIGQKSFGKGLVQNIRPLSYNTQLKVTTAKYYTPSGRCIQAINYAERNEDGSVARIPDSLKTEFRTRNGRPVYDGGGIEPDIEVAISSNQLVTQSLLKQGLIFEYANTYLTQDSDIESPRKFKLSDQAYSEFVDFVDSKDFSYETPADKQISTLQATLKEEAYSDEMESSLLEIQKKLKRLKREDLLTHKLEISRLIRKEILKQRYYKQGEIEGGLADDKDVLKAIDILLQPERYKALLNGDK